jgi:hypothetical protein
VKTDDGLCVGESPGRCRSFAYWEVSPVAVAAYQWTQTRLLCGRERRRCRHLSGCSGNVGIFPCPLCMKTPPLSLILFRPINKRKWRESFPVTSLDEARSFIERLGGWSPMSAQDLALPPAAPVTGRVVLRIRMPQKLRNIELGLLLQPWAERFGAGAWCSGGRWERSTGACSPTRLAWPALPWVCTLFCGWLPEMPTLLLFRLPPCSMASGITMIHRLDLASGASGWAAAGVRQMAWTAVALLIAIWCAHCAQLPGLLQISISWPCLLGCVLLTMPLWPGIGRTVNGATIWVQFGG